MKPTSFVAGCLLAMCACTNTATQTAIIDIDVAKTIAEVQPTMWGVFFEDINFAADGGLYAELVKNRSFEFDDPKMGWHITQSDAQKAVFEIINSAKNNPANPRYARLKIDDANATITLANNGFRGMGLKSGVEYTFSVLARNVKGSPMNLQVTLLNNTGERIGEGELTIGNSSDWQRYSLKIKSIETCAKGSLVVVVSGAGELNIDMLSLFPGDTWRQREGGLRADLVQLLADLKPGFLRFPGGCIVEGRDLSLRYQWKKTVGPVENRQLIVNRWNTEFRHRLTPDYYQSFGLGFYEYFQLAEDLGAEPLPILSCGIACQYNTGELVPLAELDEYIQDALDLVEFANGAESTRWGKLRADMGHPEPFNLKMIGVGNEQWGPQYFERYELFEKALREKYPEIKIVSGSGPYAEGADFDYAWNLLRTKYAADIVDEHYYKSPEWFLENANRYDSYPRTGPKVFAGEYAGQSVATGSPDNRNIWRCAIAEAAFLTGLERNADVVHLASYAPLFAHVEGWQWTPDLIWFDNLKSYGTTNYYVQKLFSTNRGHKVVSTLIGGENPIGQNCIYASTVVDTVTNTLIVKVVNVNEQPCPITLNVTGVDLLSEAEVITLKSDNPQAMNTIDQPELVVPKTEKLTLGADRTIVLPASSLTVMKIGLR
ncbi:MAG: alpha-L-arabinofuranosidase [Salinivirgaceae bacterium]|nr:alpha-L-arabinofuranosidase [Salinivirgaceae bacterium]